MVASNLQVTNAQIPKMISIEVPGFGELKLQHLVSDFNGTLAVDGHLLPGVKEALATISTKLVVHIITADTFGLARSELQDLPVSLAIIPLENQVQAKQDLVEKLGPSSTVAIGNGRNDSKMLMVAGLGIALIQREGASALALTTADIICTNILDALDLLNNEDRIKATLRS